MSDKVEALRKVLREVLAPLIEADGGELYLVELDKKRLLVHLAGTLSGSPACDVVARRVVAPAVRKVHPKIEIVVTNGWRVPKGAERLSPG
jgi:Fe-S cluster biogenesis protein NfuA